MLKVNKIQHKTPELYYKSQELLIDTPQGHNWGRIVDHQSCFGEK